MLGKFKQVGNDVKKSVGDIKAHTEIETEYLKAKSKGFAHSQDLTARVTIAADIQTAYEELLSCVVDWVDKYQEVINSEVKMAERFREKIAQKQQSGSGVIAKHATRYAEYQTEMHHLRQSQLGFVLEYIQLPVKKIISDQQSAKPKLETLNKAWVELKYWKSKPTQTRQQQEAQTTYDSYVKQYIEMVEKMREQADKDYPQKLAAFQQAQSEFFSSGSHISTFLDDFNHHPLIRNNHNSNNSNNTSSNSNSNNNSSNNNNHNNNTAGVILSGVGGGDSGVGNNSANMSLLDDENMYEKILFE